VTFIEDMFGRSKSYGMSVHKGVKISSFPGVPNCAYMGCSKPNP